MMNSVYVLNPQISETDKVIIWLESEQSQDLFMMLTTLGVKISGFCMTNVTRATFMGKKVYSILSMIEEGDYALIAYASSYPLLVEKYASFGLDSDRIFCVVDEKKKLMYLE